MNFFGPAVKTVPESTLFRPKKDDWALRVSLVRAQGLFSGEDISILPLTTRWVPTSPGYEAGAEFVGGAAGQFTLGIALETLLTGHDLESEFVGGQFMELAPIFTGLDGEAGLVGQVMVGTGHEQVPMAVAVGQVAEPL
jgi:hypothetical protein